MATVADRWKKERNNRSAYLNRDTRKISTKQYPKRMYRPKGLIDKDDVIYGNAIPTPEDIDRILKEENQYIHEDRTYSGVPRTGEAPINNQPSRKDNGVPDHLKGIALEYRHRYGDELDILKSKFTLTLEELENEKFKLVLASRQLLGKLFWSLSTIPKPEKYVLGGDLRNLGYSVLKNAIAIKKRFYRKNMLETMDIDLDCIRELYRIASLSHPQWVNEDHLRHMLQACNDVGCIIKGLLASTVV